jgi:hypothetical protein
MVLRLAWHALVTALALALLNTGTAIATKIPIIRITTINSIRVKPFSLRMNFTKIHLLVDQVIRSGKRKRRG